jgi:hypothetical protein
LRWPKAAAGGWSPSRGRLVGKTTLVERFVADIGAQARVHRGACENLSTPEALLPLRDIARASGEAFDPNDVLELGRDLTRLSRYSWICGRRQDAEGFIAEAIAVLERIPPGVELAWAYSHQSQLEMLASQMDAAVQWGNRALALAEQLGAEEIIIHALANIGTAKADHVRSGRCAEVERSFQLASAGNYHDHVERASCNLTCQYYNRRDYPASLGYLERGVAYAATRELTHWEAYLRGWRAMIHVDQGDWAAAEGEIATILSRVYSSDVYRFPALVALTRLRLRWGEADAATPLEEVRRLATSQAELQRSVYLGVLLAERAWLSDAEGAGIETSEATASLREIFALAVNRGAHWAADDAALWLHTLGEFEFDAAGLASPFREHCEGRWQAAAAGWAALGRPYEEAMALSEGDDEAQRRALDVFDRLSANAAAALLRRRMRARGSRAVPRGPISGTRANPAGLTRRQAQVVSLVDEGLSNIEIAARRIKARSLSRDNQPDNRDNQDGKFFRGVVFKPFGSDLTL